MILKAKFRGINKIMPAKTPTKRYQKKDPISHIIDRPDMYVGSTRLRVVQEYVAELSDDDTYKIEQKDIKSSPAILRVFVEALSNAIDNVERSRSTTTPCTKIKVSINKETGETTIWNDGDIVPIEMNAEEGCYNHSMIFGQLLTGSNYDDEEERIVAGRNGLGIKLANVFSTQFTVKGCDPEKKKVLTQTWTNNMRDTTEPVIRACKTKGFTEVSWIPDFKQFGLKGYTDDIIALYMRHVLDSAMLSKISVYLNDKIIPIKSLTQYSQLYAKISTDDKLLIKTKTADVLITPAKEFQAISFVNGVYTRLGGQHVDAWVEDLFRPIVDKFNGKDKKAKTKTPKININDVKQFFRIFVVATIIRPEFDGQDKNKLESPTVEADVKSTHINTICKWSVMDNIEDIIRSKEMMALKKVERGKKKLVKVDGLDPANNAGGKLSSLCSLFICEGLSAKTYVVAGIDTGVYGKQGRDWFGVLPVTGKVLNVRNATATSIAANKVIVSFIQTTGLKSGVDYTKEENFKTLSYGRVIIVADADVDGIHIEGLIMNLIHSLFPSLLNRPTPYIVGMKTPIARVFIPRKSDILFYDERRFNEYLHKQTSKVNAKYYKGLGTTREEDVPDTFGLKMVEYVNDDNSSNNMNKVFHRKYADARKEWLESYDPTNYSFCLDDQDKVCKMEISNFLNGEMIKFSHADCARSLPNGIDGMKESQRKILYSVFKRNLKYSGSSLKVAQLSGYTAEHSNYHHGEQNLQDTIIHMATGFPGTNNIPLLYPDGGFGTRLEGGKDAASARYIFTKLEGLTECIFRDEDTPLLTQVNDDGDLVQPEHYVPIIPMILVNGCTAGIGTGWSCNIPCYNPIDLIKCIRIWLENDGEVIIEDPDNGDKTSLLPNLVPWYRGFKGTIKQDNVNRFITEGVVSRGPKNTKSVTELPISMWTNKFKEFCEDLLEDKKIKDMKNYSTTKDVNFVLSELGDGILCNIDNLKLTSFIYTSNMVLFNEKNQLKKYDNVDEIVDNFCKVRYDFYVKRKKYQIKTLENEIRHLGNKERFIQEVIDKKLIIMNVPEEQVLDELKKREYDEEPKSGGYDYLLRLQVRTFTADKIKQLKNDIESAQTKLDTLKATSETKLWLNELAEFEKKYMSWIKDMESRVSKKAKSKK